MKFVVRSEGGVEEAYYADADISFEEAREKCKEIIQKHPEVIKCIVCEEVVGDG